MRKEHLIMNGLCNITALRALQTSALDFTLKISEDEFSTSGAQEVEHEAPFYLCKQSGVTHGT